MTRSFVPRALRAGWILLAASVASVSLSTSASAEITSTADCATQTSVFSQPFQSVKDLHSYFLAPGGDFATPADVAAAGWQLSGGASIVQTTEPNGTTGYVLDLPSKARAVSPTICVTKDFPTARMYVRNVVGGEGVQFYVSYSGTSTWNTPKNTGQVHGGTMAWQLTSPVNLQPYSTAGWQLARFTFVAGGTTSRFQVNDFWVDPRMY